MLTLAASTTKLQKYLLTRLLISSGTTFRYDSTRPGPMAEWLVVDFVDHTRCFRAQARQAFRLLQHPEVRLVQRFGAHIPTVCAG